jgi:hypothetical protein
MIYPKITPQQVAATLKNSQAKILYVYSNTAYRNKFSEFWDEESKNFYCIPVKSETVRGRQADIVIIDFTPNAREQGFLQAIISGPQGDIIQPRGIYFAHIPEPKTIEERLAALEELVAEGQKWGFYGGSHPDDDIFKK